MSFGTMMRFRANGTLILPGDPEWDQVVLSIHGDTVSSNGGDPYYNYVTLLMHMDGVDQGTTFTDQSGTPKSVSGSNTVTKTAFKKFGNTSAYFSGGLSRLTVPDSASWDFGAGDFTIECWFYPNNTNAGVLVCQTDAPNPVTNHAFVCRTSTGGGLRLSLYVGGSEYNVDAPGGSITANNWYHAAFVRSGANFYIFLNGALVGSGSPIGASALNNSTSVLTIGSQNNSWEHSFLGYIDDLRITKGIARYTSVFTPSNQAFPHLLETLTFNEAKGRSFTGNATFVESPSKFGAGAIQSIGYGYNGLAVVSSPDLQLHNSDFTIECWAYSTIASGVIAGKASTTAALSEWSLSFSSTQLRFFFYNASQVLVSTVVAPWVNPLNTWVYFAVTRQGSTFRLFANGVLLSTVSSTDAINVTASPLTIGYVNPTGTFQGYIEEFRVTKGVARYTNDFSNSNFPHTTFLLANPDYGQPIDPFWNNVILALHMNGNNGGTLFSCEKGSQVYVQSGAVNTSTADKKFGLSSAYFDGTSDYLQATAWWDFGTGNFTIDCWVKPLDSRLNCILAMDSGSADGFNMVVNGTNFSFDGVSAGNYVVIGEWNYLAVSRVGGVVYMYVNGEFKHSYANTQNYTPLAGLGQFIGNERGFGWNFYGYLDDLRITKGVGRFNSTTTIPVPTRAFPRN